LWWLAQLRQLHGTVELRRWRRRKSMRKRLHSYYLRSARRQLRNHRGRLWRHTFVRNVRRPSNLWRWRYSERLRSAEVYSAVLYRRGRHLRRHLGRLWRHHQLRDLRFSSHLRRRRQTKRLRRGCLLTAHLWCSQMWIRGRRLRWHRRVWHLRYQPDLHSGRVRRRHLHTAHLRCRRGDLRLRGRRLRWRRQLRVLSAAIGVWRRRYPEPMRRKLHATYLRGSQSGMRCHQ
jgi:hypothetical protein